MAIQKEDYTRVIYDKGCLRAGEEWVERNLVPVAGVAVAIATTAACHRCRLASLLLASRAGARGQLIITSP